MTKYRVKEAAELYGQLPVGGDVGAKLGQLLIGAEADSDYERIDTKGLVYCHFQSILKKDGEARDGFVYKPRLELVTVTPPEPPPASEETIVATVEAVVTGMGDMDGSYLPNRVENGKVILVKQ